jgi:phage shock protein A
MIVHNRIEGTRITVWDVLHYLEAGWSRPDIAATLHLTEAQVAAAASYIEEHRDEVMGMHRQIEERKARGNSPEIRAKVAKSRAKVQAWLTHHHKVNT